jgi:hypothetical protein
MVEKNINNRIHTIVMPDEPCQNFPARLMVTIQPNTKTGGRKYKPNKTLRKNINHLKKIIKLKIKHKKTLNYNTQTNNLRYTIMVVGYFDIRQ